jgi:aspartyl-tRNA(Asn)/glutamyl-tRNA(Gln) amidotransferase subunit A
MRLKIAEWSELSLAAQQRIYSTALGRARRINGRLEAFVSFAARDERSPRGPLAFLPFAAKDLFFDAGRSPSVGLAAPPYPSSGSEAPTISTLESAGAHFVGYTAMTELAYEPSGYNAVVGYARNPWQLEFIPGGSSSGSAAAVASGAVAVALGSDTGGSIRIPAHCCGVTGWKPSWGRISAAGAIPLAPSLDCIGLLARSASDLSPVVDVLLGSADQSGPIETAVILSDILEEAEPSIRRACNDGIDALRSVPIALSDASALHAITRIDTHALNIMQGEAARVHGALLAHSSLSPILRRRLSKGFEISDTTLTGSRAMRTELCRNFMAVVLGKADAAVLPVMPIRTPRLSEVDPASPAFSGRRLYELSRYCRFVNMLGLPAIAIPVGFDDRGLPVAMQIVGRNGTDRALIAVASAIQRATSWHSRIPCAVADIISSDAELFQ